MKRLSVITMALLVTALTVAGCNSRPPVDIDRTAGWITLLEPTEVSLNSWNRIGDANWHLYRGAIVHLAHVHPMPKAGGKWNTYEITARGSRISVWLNGEPTVDLVHDKLVNGPIALQYAGGEIRFRKVLIKPL